jgi:hypothetical protein
LAFLFAGKAFLFAGNCFLFAGNSFLFAGNPLGWLSFSLEMLSFSLETGFVYAKYKMQQLIFFSLSTFVHQILYVFHDLVLIFTQTYQPSLLLNL